MGGLSRKTNHLTYVTLSKGKMAIRVPHKTEESHERTLEKGKNKGKTIYEEYYNVLAGLIVKIEKKNEIVEWQKKPYLSLNITIDDQGSLYLLTMSYSSSYAASFMTRIEAIDPGKEITIESYWVEGDDGKERGYLGIIQSGEKVQRLYHHNDGVYPNVEYHDIKGEIYADDTERLEFFDKILEKVAPLISVISSHKEEAPPAGQPNEQEPAETDYQIPEEMTEEEEQEFIDRFGSVTKKF